MTAPLVELTPPVFTLMTAASLGLLGAGLAVAVIVLRVLLGIEAGDGGDPQMAQAVRAHASFAELAPLGLLLLAMLEVNGASLRAVLAVAALLLVGRLLSAFGLSRSLGPSFPRQAGASATILSMLLSFVGLALLVIGFRP